MKLSSRGRYAIIIMINLAKNEYMSLKDIADSENISMKYLEKIMALLVKADLVTSTHGKFGGYKLNRKPEDYKIGDILRVTEGNMEIAPCINDSACEKKENCTMYAFYNGLYNNMSEYMDNQTLKDLI